MQIKAVVFGGHDSGKSTLTGYLLFQYSGLDPRSIAKIESQAIGLLPWKKYTYFASKYFQTRSVYWQVFIPEAAVNNNNEASTLPSTEAELPPKKLTFILTDTPGYANFKRNAIGGMAANDIGILVVSIEIFEFQSIKDQLIIAYTFGIKYLIVVITWVSVKNAEEKFGDLKAELTSVIKKVVIVADTYIGAIPWYTGTTLDDGLRYFGNKVMERPNLLLAKPFRMIVKYRYRIGGIGTVYVGKIKAMEQVCLAPPNKVSTAKTLESSHTSIAEGTSGDFIGMNLSMMAANECPIGSVVGRPSDDPPQKTASFVARIVVINHPNGGYTPTLFCHSAHVPCQLKEIIVKLDKVTEKELERSPKIIHKGEAALVHLVPLKPICVERYSEYPTLGRFFLMDSDVVVCAGIVKDVIFASNIQ